MTLHLKTHADALMKLKLKIHEAFYWYGRRPAQKLFLGLIWKLPDRVVYWCVIRAACRVEPNGGNALLVSASDMMDAFAPESVR